MPLLYPLFLIGAFLQACHFSFLTSLFFLLGSLVPLVTSCYGQVAILGGEIFSAMPLLWEWASMISAWALMGLTWVTRSSLFFVRPSNFEQSTWGALLLIRHPILIV